MAIFSKPVIKSHPLPLPPRLTQRPFVLAFLVLILLRSRTLSFSKDVLLSIRDKAKKLLTLRRKTKLTKDELAKVLQQVYIDEEDGSQTLLVPYRERVVKVCVDHQAPFFVNSITNRFPYTGHPNHNLSQTQLTSLYSHPRPCRNLILTVPSSPN